MSINAQSLKQLHMLVYNKIWMEYGFLSKEQLDEQYNKHMEAKSFPENDVYGNIHTEHLRHESFLRIVKERQFFTDEEVSRIIELVEVDDDILMAKNVFVYLIEENKLNLKQLKKIKKALGEL